MGQPGVFISFGSHTDIDKTSPLYYPPWTLLEDHQTARLSLAACTYSWCKVELL